MPGYKQRKVLREVSEILRPGDIVNFDSKAAWWNLAMRFVFSQIRRAQKKKFGKKSRYRDIHSVLVLRFDEAVPGVMFNPKVLSVTVPEAVIEPLRISKRTRKVTVCRLKGAGDGFSDEWLKTMREAAISLVGTEYDYLQLLAIKLKLQRWPRWITCWLDLGKKRTVCSGGVQYCLLKAWREWIKPFEPLSNAVKTVISCPLNGTRPCEVYPAHFVNRPESFTIVKEWKL